MRMVSILQLTKEKKQAKTAISIKMSEKSVEAIENELFSTNCSTFSYFFNSNRILRFNNLTPINQQT